MVRTCCDRMDVINRAGYNYHIHYTFYLALCKENYFFLIITILSRDSLVILIGLISKVEWHLYRRENAKCEDRIASAEYE